MRERELVLQGSFCDTNLYQGGPKTTAEAIQRGRSFCPHRGECERGYLEDHSCAMRFSMEVVRNSIKLGTSIATEMQNFRRGHTRQPKGWVYSLDRKEFKEIPESEQAMLLVEQFTHILLDDGEIGAITDQSANPRVTVGERFEDVFAHALTDDGSLDLRKIQELEGRFGYNGGKGCDTRDGPCSCGAWH